ncbi:hypothetical protein [Actinopolyspora mortivallis]|uniref:Uncharacterized protein n=1 Tax=Actinopolyspora mortivallis TaxID=33906 RepID=A0A2T0GX22_ACTMO|nr:hypothetical protein [Actinopolyspora mortivallis]PRW63652.1 hypothetical protein CEP50_09315 [Actinopolyspora mortivallis]
MIELGSTERVPEEAEEFRAVLRDYVRMYAFLSQVIPYYDTDLEQLYLFGKHLFNVLPRGADNTKFLDDQQVRDDYIRLARRRAYEMIHRDVA